MKAYTLEQIYHMLGRQRFHEWYSEGGRFDRHIREDEECPSKDEILMDLKRLLG